MTTNYEPARETKHETVEQMRTAIREATKVKVHTAITLVSITKKEALNWVDNHEAALERGSRRIVGCCTHTLLENNENLDTTKIVYMQ